ncbi:hypothetical protein BC826DRAFT_613580 [Russula brevipes]|nr:hypothetical protein BC826DRAFT_613580 [Russula brevipes]
MHGETCRPGRKSNGFVPPLRPPPFFRSLPSHPLLSIKHQGPACFQNRSRVTSQVFDDSMSNGSSTAFLCWAILASLFLVFLLYHLWSYDRLQCLRWNAGRQPGAFRRFMTYSYLGSTPLLIIFGVGITTLKFKEGFVVLSGDEILPKPPNLWSKSHQHQLLALFYVFSIAWALEQMSHFEELAFWFFLLHQGAEKRDWFTSWEYKTWSICCVAAILGMPLTTLVSRNNIVTVDAWIFFVGALTSSTTNVLFISVLVRFPSFLRHVKAEGANPDVVVRLATFYEFNLVRIVFRFAAAIPLLILAADGIRGPHPVNRNLFWSDILLIISAIGQFISSLITIMIFFPRSLTREYGYRPRVPSTTTATETYPQDYVTPELVQGPTQVEIRPSRRTSFRGTPKSMSRDRTPSPPQTFSSYSYTRPNSDVPIELAHPPAPVRRSTLSDSVLHPLVTTYMSPIDLVEAPPDGAP